MPYRPSVVRQAPDVQDLGSAITRAFESHELSGMRKKAQEKEDFRFEREAEGHGFYRDEEVQPPAPRPQATSPESPQSPGGGYQAGPGNTPDPGGLDFGGIGMAGRELRQPSLEVPGAEQAFGTFMGASRQEMQRPAILPGAFVPGGGFTSTAVYAPETPTEMGGRTYRRDASRTPEARASQAAQAEQQRGQAEFQTRIDELVNAGVPENMAAAVSRDPTAARAFLAPPEEEPGYAMEDLVKLGLPPELARIVYGKPDLLEEILTDQQRAQLTRGTEAERARLRQEELRTASTLRRGDTSHAEGLRRERETAVQALRNAGGGAGGRRIADLKTAFDLLDRAYGEYDQWGELVGNTLGTQERFQLAEDLVAGTLDPSALPNPPVDEEPEVDDGPSWIDRLTGWISGAQPAAAEGRGPAPDDADPVEAEDPPAEDPQATIREAQSLIAPMLRRGTGGQSPSSIEEVRDMLVELEFTPEEIEMIVQPYIRGR